MKCSVLSSEIVVFGKSGVAPRVGGGGRGATTPLKVSKKEKKIRFGVFSCIKISFSVIFNNEIHGLRGLLSWF